MTDIKQLDFNNTEIAFGLKSDKELLEMGRMFSLMNKATLVKMGTWFTIGAMKLRLPFFTKLVENTIFKQFCGGTNLENAQAVIDKLYEVDCMTILDYGAEGKETEEDFDHTMNEAIRAIEFASQNPGVPVLSSKFTGLAKFSLLEKLQAGKTLTKEEVHSLDLFRKRVDKMCEAAARCKVGLMVDAEETWIQDVIDDLVEQMMEKYNKEKAIVYNTYQLYRKDKYDDLIRAFEKAQQKGYWLGAKLVRGAYLEKERERAAEMGYSDPMHISKAHTDHDYNESLRFCVENYERIASCNATHNAESCLLQAEWIMEKGIQPNHDNLNFCQLLGMSDNISFNLAEGGFNVAKYVPYGPVRDIIPYLLRRAQENSSVTGDMSREYSFILKELRRRGLKK